MVDLEPGLFADGPLAGAPRDPERLSEAISALIEDAATTVREASLILPDEWLRVAFAEAVARQRLAMIEPEHGVASKSLV